MKRSIQLAIVSLFIAVPSWLCAQQERGGDYNHATVGIFADYLRLDSTNPNINFVGVGARTGFHTGRFAEIEAEMHYDFERNYTTTFNNGVSTQFVTTKLRPLTGLVGPKFETPGRFKIFATGKVGFIRFSETSSPVTFGTFGNSVSGVGGPGTHLALYPGGGVEGYWGPFGLRAEVGDEIYLNNGTYNNLRVTFGPQIRF